MISGTSTPQFSSKTALDAIHDSHSLVYRGPTRNVRLPRASSHGGGAIAKSPDEKHCVVAGKESLRVLTITDSLQQESISAHKSSVGKGGHKVEASKNYWEGSGLKVDSAFTDTAWCHGQYNNKILTSGRNGELIMWDLNKTGSTKYERRVKDHLRAIHRLVVSPLVPNYCLTGSTDGDLRVWDLRDLRKSIIRIHHPTGVRGVAFSPVVFQPLQAVVGLDNGNIFRWDLKVGQRGRLDRIAVAHTASVTSLDWCTTSGSSKESVGDDHGWLASGGLDRTVKVWDLTHGHISHKPKYTLHTSFPVRHVLWRPKYECELAIVSNADFGSGNNPDLNTPTIPLSGLSAGLQPPPSRRSPSLGLGLDFNNNNQNPEREQPVVETPRPRSYAAAVASGSSTPTTPPRITLTASSSTSGAGDLAEIWDVRRGWIAKWQIVGSALDGGLSDISFGADSHTVWGQHFSGMFSQIDLRDATKPIDAVGRVAVTWDAGGALSFVSGRKDEGEVPYDDAAYQSHSNDGRKNTHKTLGDAPFVPVSQNLGSFQSTDSLNDIAVFTKLAKDYVLEGESRREICALNAQAAFDACQYRAAQVWLLVEASLATLIPGESPSPSKPRPPSPTPPHVPLIQSNSAPAAMSTNHPERNSPGPLSDHSSERINSPNSYQQRSLSGGRMTFYTPSSSTNTSPRQSLGALPPTPLSSSSRRFSNLARRNSIDPNSSLTRPQLSSSRRPSAAPRRPSNSTHSASPSTASLRHVGEGALDDSDSESSGDEENDEENGFEEGSGGEDAVPQEQDYLRLTLISPSLAPTRISHPSPLSRVASNRWTEDEGGTDGKDDDEASASPRSTDSEGEGHRQGEGLDIVKRKRAVSSRRSSVSKLKTRSRSSTMVSAQTMGSRRSSTRSILRHESLMSIMTIKGSGIDLSMTPRDSEEHFSSRHKSDEVSRSARHKRSNKSIAISELVLVEDDNRQRKEKVEEHGPLMSKRQHEAIVEEEERYREMVWSSLRESIEMFADEGDIQLCAMLAIIVPRELRIRQRQRLAFIESYIDRLTRLRLHVCAAYVRKYSQVDGISAKTLLETTIYTACGRCRKPFIIPPGQANLSRSGYTYCPRCKRETSICSICRLPVHGILFQCSICAHGGHQACYDRYYAQRVMDHVPHTIPIVRTPTNTSSSSENESTNYFKLSRSMTSSRASIDTTSTIATTATATEEDGYSAYGSTADASSEGGGMPVATQVSHLAGRPCAAGCGHYCWVAKVSGGGV